MKRDIPQNFLDLADEKGLALDIATDFYINKTAKSEVDTIKFRLMEDTDCSYTEASRILTALWRDYKKAGILSSSTTTQISRPNNLTYIERASLELDKIIGKIHTKPARNSHNNEKGRIAIAGDFHFPFANRNALEALLNDPADILVIMGDYFDMYSASKYRQTTDRHKVSEELAIGKAYMAKLSEKFSKIYIIKGNHDSRGIRRVQETLPQLTPLIVHPVDLLAFAFDNVEVLSTTIPTDSLIGTEDIELEFAGQYNDCLFGHFEGFFGPDAPRKLDTWCSEWSHIVNFDPELRVIFQAHTHRLQMEYTSKGRLLVGTGCMCNPMQYQLDGHAKFKPPTIGYVAIYQDKGKTDMLRTQLISVGLK